MKEPLLYFLAALLFTLLLGFIDEGYYSFSFLLDIGNVLVLSMYLLVFWSAQLFIDWLLERFSRLRPGVRKSITVMAGLFLPIAIIMLAFTGTKLD